MKLYHAAVSAVKAGHDVDIVHGVDVVVARSDDEAFGFCMRRVMEAFPHEHGWRAYDVRLSPAFKVPAEVAGKIGRHELPAAAYGFDDMTGDAAGGAGDVEFLPKPRIVQTQVGALYAYAQLRTEGGRTILAAVVCGAWVLFEDGVKVPDTSPEARRMLEVLPRSPRDHQPYRDFKAEGREYQ